MILSEIHNLPDTQQEHEGLSTDPEEKATRLMAVIDATSRDAVSEDEEMKGCSAALSPLPRDRGQRRAKGREGRWDDGVMQIIRARKEGSLPMAALPEKKPLPRRSTGSKHIHSQGIYPSERLRGNHFGYFTQRCKDKFVPLS